MAVTESAIMLVESKGELEALAMFRAMDKTERARMLKLGAAMIAGTVTAEAVRDVSQKGRESIRVWIDAIPAGVQA